MEIIVAVSLPKIVIGDKNLGLYSIVRRCSLPLLWGHDSENDGRSSIGGIFSNSMMTKVT